MKPSILRLVTVLLSLSTPALGSTLYVDVALASGANDGTSWANAFRGPAALQNALGTAVVGDQIWVKAGSYLPTTGSDRALSFVMKSGVELYGGFAGGETSVAQRDPELNPTVLSGDLAGNDGGGSFGDNSFHVVSGGSADAAALLDGFVIRGGNANDGVNTLHQRGGGLNLIAGSHVRIRRCIVRENRASARGGGGYVANSSPTLSECVFEDNFGGVGGGLYVFDGITSIDRCVFRSNHATVHGGGVYAASSAPILTAAEVSNSLFVLNSAEGLLGGGAIYAGGNDVLMRVQNCTVVSNSSTGGPGAGIAVGGFSTWIVNSIVQGNTGPGGSQTYADQLSGSPNAGPLFYCCIQGLAATVCGGAAAVFAAPTSGDYRLASGSVGIDAGINSEVTVGAGLDLLDRPRFVDDPATADLGFGSSPLVDLGALEHQPADFLPFCVSSAVLCPCGNAGAPGRGCDNAQATGGVLLSASGSAAANDVVLHGSGYPASASPGVVVMRSPNFEPAPVTFGDGMRCVGAAGLVRLGATNASGGASTHPLNHGAGPGVFRYQLWYRNTPATFCTPGGFNLSNGLTITWP